MTFDPVRDGLVIETARARELATALPRLARDESIRLLEWSTTNDKSWAVKAASAKALGQCHNLDAIPTLETHLADSNIAVQTMSAGAIIKLSLKL